MAIEKEMQPSEADQDMELEQNAELEQAVEDIIQNTTPSSKGKKEQKLCKTKTFKYDIFKDLKDQKVNATFSQLAEILTFRQ